MKRFLICATLGLLGLAVLAGSSTACPWGPALGPNAVLLPDPGTTPSVKPGLKFGHKIAPRFKRRPGAGISVRPGPRPGWKATPVVPLPPPRPGRIHRR
jgi:hypothetical protein